MRYMYVYYPFIDKYLGKLADAFNKNRELTSKEEEFLDFYGSNRHFVDSILFKRNSALNKLSPTDPNLDIKREFIYKKYDFPVLYRSMNYDYNHDYMIESNARDFWALVEGSAEIFSYF